MKSKLSTSIFVVVALIIGFGVGYYQASRKMGQFFLDSIYLNHANRTRAYVRVLTQMHHGEMTNAYDTLEMSLDGSLITFTVYDQVPPEQQNKSILQAIQVAKDYRSDYPRKIVILK